MYRSEFTGLKDFSESFVEFLKREVKSGSSSNKIKFSYEDEEFIIKVERLEKLKFYMPCFEFISSGFFVKAKRSRYSKFVWHRLDTERLKSYKPDFNKFFEVRSNDFQEALKQITSHKCFEINREFPLVWVVYPDGFTEVREIRNGKKGYHFGTPFEFDFSTEPFYRIEKPHKKPPTEKVEGRVFRVRNIHNTDGYVYR